MLFYEISYFFDENRVQNHHKLFLAIRNNKYTSEKASRGRTKIWERTGDPEGPDICEKFFIGMGNVYFLDTKSHLFLP